MSAEVCPPTLVNFVRPRDKGQPGGRDCACAPVAFIGPAGSVRENIDCPRKKTKIRVRDGAPAGAQFEHGKSEPQLPGTSQEKL